MLILCYVYFLVKDACLFFVVLDLILSCGAIVVSPCWSHWCNNWNEPLNLGNCWTKTWPGL